MMRYFNVQTTMRCCVLLLACLGSTSDALAQINMKWFHRENTSVDTMTTPKYDIGHGVDVDDDGNAYVIGTWADTLNNGFASLFSEVNDKYNSYYLRKVSPSGALVWRLPIRIVVPSWMGNLCFFCKNKSNDVKPVIRLADDKPIVVSDDAVFVAGYIEPGDPRLSPVTLYLGAAVGSALSIPSSNPNQILGFLAKYSLTGDLLDVKTFRSNGSTNTQEKTLFNIRSIDAGYGDDIYLAGNFNGQIDMEDDNSTGVSGSWFGGSFRDAIHVSRFDNNNMKWRWTSYVSVGNGGTIDASSISAENNEIYISGSYKGDFYEYGLVSETDTTGDSYDVSTTFINDHLNDPDSALATQALIGYSLGFPVPSNADGNGNPSQDAFLWRLADDGIPDWMKKFGGQGIEYGGPVLYEQNDLFMTVYSSDAAPSTDVSFNTAPNVYTDMASAYVAKLYNTSINRVHWVYPIYAAGGVTVSSLTYSAKKELYIAGNFYGIVDLLYEPADGTSTYYYRQNGVMTAIGNTDGFAIKLRPDLYREWAVLFGGTNLEYVEGIMAYDDDFLVTGGFYETVDFQPSQILNYSQTSLGESDAFVARYGCYDIALTANSLVGCQGEPLQITATSECPSGCSYSYEWETAIGTQTTTSPTFYYTGAVGTNTIILTATEQNSGCVVEASIEVVINPSVSISVNPSSILLCDGSPASFAATSTPNGASFEWFYVDTSNLVGTGPNFTTSLAGTYVARATLNGCYADFPVVYNQYADLEPYITPIDPSICGGGVAPMQVGGCPGCSYSWTVPFGSSASSSSNTLLADRVGYYSVLITDGNGCNYILSEDVTLSPNLTPAISAENVFGSAISTICNSNPVILQTANVPTYSYHWSDGSTVPFTVAFAPGNYQVTVVDNQTGCTGVTQNIVIQSATVVSPSLTADPYNICNGDPAVLEVTNPCASCAYQWYENSTGALGGVIGISVNRTTPGDYYVEVTDSFGCRALSNIQVIDTNQASIPLIWASADELCGTNFTTLSTTPCTGCSYQWYFNGTLILGATMPDYTTNQTGTYQVEVTYTNSCSNLSDPHPITNQVPAFTPTIQAILPTHGTICDGAPVMLGITGSNIQAPPAWQYQWFYNGSIITGGTGINQYAYSPGDYYVRVTNEFGCTRISNVLDIDFSNTGAGPVALAAPDFVCSGTSAVLSVGACTGCQYQWFDANNILITGEDSTVLVTPYPTGYYVRITSPEGCMYNSNLIDVQDSVLTTPSLTTLSSPFCSSTPVVLSTPACVGCNYMWVHENDMFVLDTVQTGPQNTYSSSSTGNYTVLVTTSAGCKAESAPVRVTFSTINAQLLTPSTTTICNSVSVPLQVLPSAVNCVGCTYKWYRNGVQLSAGNTSTLNVTAAGNYHAVVLNTDGCGDTTSTITFVNATNMTSIVSDASIICDTNYVVQLSVPTCVGCSYQWALNGFPIAGALGSGPTYNVIGFAAEGVYTVSVNKSGCIASDTIVMVRDTVPPIFSVGLTSVGDNNGSICNGALVTLSSSCPSCNNQWYVDGVAVPAPIGQLPSLLTDSAGVYLVEARDSNGCRDLSPTDTLIEVDPPANFALDFDTLSILPISYGMVDLSDYLTPTTIHPGSALITTGEFSSVTIQSGSGLTGLGYQILNPMAAGPGIHIIRYDYTQSSCPFFTRDTIQILDPISILVSNTDPNAPQYEACVGDQLVVRFNNFTFIPTQVILSAGGTDTIQIPITPTLTYFGGVWNGSDTIIIPADAKTGHLTATDGTAANTFITDFFVVIRNPEIIMSLNGVPTPLCSNSGNITLVGTPSGGLFRAAYQSAPTTYVPSLISGNNLVTSNVTNYDLNGDQQLRLSYWYPPTYTGTNYVCSDTLVTYLTVDMRDVKVDSVLYSPISLTQSEEAMENLTRFVYPLQTRFYENHYIGTYISNDTILPSTISGGWGTEPITYQVVNDGCMQTHTDTIMIWPRPNMNPIPKFICREDPVIYIGRDSIGIYYVVGGITSPYQDPLYVYQYDQEFTNPNYAYIERTNLMEVYSSAGGLTPLNLNLGEELYALDPAAISGSNTTLTIRYKYRREHTYFIPSTSASTTEYTIAEITKQIFIEEPFTAQISPAIVADPVFCQENVTMQFSGIPVGTNGQYYLDGTALINNIFNPINYTVGSHNLKYVYTGAACKDSAQIAIYIPQPFTISVVAPTGPEYCVNDPNDPITFSVSGIPASVIDSSSGLFFIGGIQSGSIFAPSQLLPNIYPVTYSIADTFGCRESANDTFIVHDIPQLTMTNLLPDYCLNAGLLPFSLFHGAANISASGYPSGGTATLTGNGFIGGTPQTNPNNPVYQPMLAGVGLDTIIYTYTDTNLCTHTISDVVLIEPLPILSMATTGGAPILQQYCEGSIVPLWGTPFGGDWDIVSSTNTNEFNLDTVNNQFVAFISDNFMGSAIEVFQYAYTDPATGCRDTITEDIEVLNYTVLIDIQGVNPVLCADDVDLPVTAAQTIYTGSGITTGTFTFSELTGLVQTGGLTAMLYPDTLGIVDIGKTITITFSYLDGICPNQVSESYFVNPIPQLSYDLPGARILGSISTQQHTCYEFTASEPMSVFNRYNGITSNVTTQGTYLSGDGVVLPAGTAYNAVQAGPGMDIISFTYTHPTTGCTNVIIDSVQVDTVPPLDMVGYPAGLTDPYTYCANEIPHLVIPSPFGGQMYFNGSVVSGNVFNLHPGQLAAPIPVDTLHRLAYVYVAARYTDGRICVDSTADTILIHPTPVLSMATTIPTEYCLGADTIGMIPLYASPAGGVFEDITSVTIVNGIIQDTLFNAMAQLGDRTVLYWYEEPTTGCRDSITHTIGVYRVPHVGFSTGGGCVGTTVQFNPENTLLDNTFPAQDNLTDVIWHFGDGVVDTVTNLANPIQVPVQTHVYPAAGVYFPMLVLSNNGSCDTSYTTRVVISPRQTVTESAAYFQDFQEGTGGWMQEQGNLVGVPQDTVWEWGMANGQRINTVFFENNVWVTRRDLPYNKGDEAWVYSPCFDISDLERPMIALDIWRDSRQGVDGTVLEYFDTVSQSWNVLGYRGKGLEWFNPSFVIAGPGAQTGAPIGWSGISNGWDNARYRLDAPGHDLRNRRNVRFRVAFAASPNTIVNGLEGFAFDNVYIGNRRRSILVEHFTNINYPNIEDIEPVLYDAIYNNLYGRDVSLIQYHVNVGGTDPQYNLNQEESNARKLYYSIEEPNQVRLNGQNLVANTTELVNNQLDLLDKEMLEDPAFEINFLTAPQFVFNGNLMNVEAEVVALQNMPFDEYSIQVVMTEDSVENQDEDYPMMAVMRDMLETSAGLELNQAWVIGDAQTVQHAKTIDASVINPVQCELVIFVQNMRTKKVYQVATTRNLTIYEGPLPPTGVEGVEGNEIADMVLFPNPTQDYFNVRFDQPLAMTNEWRLVDMAGRVLQDGIIEQGNTLLTVYTQELPAGMYIFSVRNGNVYSQRKVIISR